MHASRSLDQPLRYCCYGWSNFFYVPSFALEAFDRLTNALHSEHVEVAILTVAALLGRCHASETAAVRFETRWHTRPTQTTTNSVDTNWD